eukprot:TRINITY_DN25479_c0_g2_i1.p1 TRINITY_DN25479_c0_g2~~TRINITY_DN25479_c0_g2_i1.p1  ORF type:complete len:554 (+),score=79.53 TRINITY_DN25479_c0_g2_i1:150-1811(+)
MTLNLSRGEELHHRIPACRWCVTKADLRHLRSEVQRSIVEGVVFHTVRDPFEISDTICGPNMYTVNEQLIKPVTAAAGGMSWALMRHEDGLPCDIFVSHAWEEGTYEFIDKVLHSWASEGTYAWCCMLAIPQNLNITSLISDPRSSPFADALYVSKHVLAVPNMKASIYSRVWCTYEAFLAIENDKKIFMATGSRFQEKAVTSLQLCFSGLVSGVLGILVLGTAYRRFLDRGAWCTFLLCGLLALVVRTTSQWKFYIHLFGVCATSFELAQVLAPSTFDYLPGYPSFFRYAVWLIALGYFLLSDLDRIELKSALAQRRMLQTAYDGIRNAKCSSQADACNIRSDIADKMDEVDHTIEVLIHAGMSTSCLRKTASAGVDVQDAGHMEVAIPFVTFFSSLLASSILLWVPQVSPAWAAVLLLPLLGFVATACALKHERRAFLFKVSNRMGALFFISCVVLDVVIKLHGSSNHYLREFIVLVVVLDLALVVSMLLALIGSHRLAKLPWIGPRATQVLMERGVYAKTFWSWLFGCKGSQSASETLSESDKSVDSGLP